MKISLGILAVGAIAISALVGMIALLGCESNEDGSRGTSCPPITIEDPRNLRVDAGASFGMHPGESRTLGVAVEQCCYWLEPIPKCHGVQWSLSPGAPATIEHDGTLHVDTNAEPGVSFLVSAAVDSVAIPLTVKVTVYTTASNPLVGRYRESGRLACDNGQETSPSDPIGELVFRADGTFSVTFDPFEVYRDYWGTYVHDTTTGTLTLADVSGNYVPSGLDLDGTFTFEESSLVLRDMWLGLRPSSSSAIECGHRFVP